MLRRGEPARMWFRRLFRRRRPPPPVLLPSLERLAELIERVVELLDEVALSPPREPAPPATPAPDPPPDPVSSAAPNATPNPGHSVSGHLLLVVLAGRLSAAGAGRSPARPARPAGRRRRRIQRAPARAFAAAGRLAPLRVPREGGTVHGGSNLRPVKEESQIHDMRAALQGDRERAEQARQRSVENVRALYETPPPEPRARATSPTPNRSGLS